MSRRIRQGIKDIEKDITDFERTVQNVKASKSKSVDHNIKRDKQLKPFVTEPISIREVVPRVRRKSKEKTEAREIHKQVLENKNATVVITVRTKHSHVSKKRSKVNESPCRSRRDARSVHKEDDNLHSAIISKEPVSVKDREVKGLPWSSLLNNQKFDYETCSSIYSGCSQPNNIQTERSTTESKYVYKNNCSSFSQRHDFELKARVDQSVQCPVQPCACVKTDPIGELKSLFTDVLNTLQKSQAKDSDVERNLNKQKSFEEDEPVRLREDEPVRLPPKKSSGFIPLNPVKSSPPAVISAPVPILPTLEEKADTASSSPSSMQKQLEITNLLLEQTYKEIALKCEEYRKERDQLREEVIQQQKKVQTLMEKEKDHLLVINSLQADINSKTKQLQNPAQEASKTESHVVESSRRNSELELELQLLRLQSDKYQTLMANKEKEIARFRLELQGIKSVIQDQLDNCKLIHCKATSGEASFDKKGNKPVCSSPTSSAVSLGTLESWQRISCISASTDVGHESSTGVILGEKLTLPKHDDSFQSTIMEATAVISDTESVKKMRTKLSKVFEEIRNSRLSLPSPPRTYTDLNDSHWTDLSVGTLKNGGSLDDTMLTQASDDRV